MQLFALFDITFILIFFGLLLDAAPSEPILRLEYIAYDTSSIPELATAAPSAIVVRIRLRARRAQCIQIHLMIPPPLRGIPMLLFRLMVLNNICKRTFMILERYLSY